MLWRLRRSPSVNISAITDRKDKNHELPILNLVDDPKVAVAYPVDIVFSCKFFHASRARVKRESVDLAGKSQPSGGLELSKLTRSGCRYLNPVRARSEAIDFTLPSESTRSAPVSGQGRVHA